MNAANLDDYFAATAKHDTSTGRLAAEHVLHALAKHVDQATLDAALVQAGIIPAPVAVPKQRGAR